jgi:hypothetical protein
MFQSSIIFYQIPVGLARTRYHRRHWNAKLNFQSTQLQFFVIIKQVVSQDNRKCNFE